MLDRGEWGEFFSEKLSPFGYNETVANEQFPLTKEAAFEQSLSWKESDPRDFLTAEVEIADSVQETPDAVVDKLLACSTCSKNYRVIRKELAFYRKMNLPLPRSYRPTTQQ